MKFRHEIIDDSPPCGRLGICLPTDLTGNGLPDLIVGGLGSESLPLVGVDGIPLIGRLLRRLETNIFWYENPGWQRHALSSASNLFVFGNTLGDVTGNGRMDLFVGQGIGHNDIYWFEQPKNPRNTWTRHLVASDFNKYHDLAFGDVNNDGEPELVGTSQESEVVFYYDVPDEPTRSPWPESCLNIIDRDRNVEGLEIVDIDGDGANELIAGTSIYHPPGAGEADSTADGSEGNSEQGVANGWYREPIVNGWDWTRVAVGDLDGDSELEVVFSEGDSPLLGNHMGRVGWFDPPDWEPNILHDEMYCPHSVQIADFTGDGRSDIYVGEMGLDVNDNPQHVVFRNTGGGQFEETIIDRGTPTHEAKAVDLTGSGTVDIVGKSYEPDTHVDVWFNES